MDAGALMEYFKPLLEWLREQNGNDFGWDPQCPDLSAKPTQVTTHHDNCDKQSHNGASDTFIYPMHVLVLIMGFLGFLVSFLMHF